MRRAAGRAASSTAIIPPYPIEGALISTQGLIEDIERAAQKQLEETLAASKAIASVSEGFLRRGRL